MLNTFPSIKDEMKGKAQKFSGKPLQSFFCVYKKVPSFINNMEKQIPAMRVFFSWILVIYKWPDIFIIIILHSIWNDRLLMESHGVSWVYDS